MSYYRELKDFILDLRGGGFFLSPRDAWFLKFLEEEGYPLEVVKEGIRRFFLFFPPERRSKLPLFMSYKKIAKLNKHYREPKKADWKERFYQKLEMVKAFLEEDFQIPEPKDMGEAEELLQNIERQIAQKLWNALNQGEKESLLRKFSIFKEDKELLKAMIKRELLKKVGLRSLSLFLD
ncbi:MAG: hypothetical protein ACK4OF_01175 [Aquificaceae bacterium]